MIEFAKFIEHRGMTQVQAADYFGVECITLAGVNTHAYIRMAAIDAYQRDIRVTIARDCVGTCDEEHGRVSLEYMNGKIGRA